jgi:hypothetical protein
MSDKYNIRLGDKLIAAAITAVLMYFFCTWYFPMAFQHMVDGLNNWQVK